MDASVLLKPSREQNLTPRALTSTVPEPGKSADMSFALRIGSLQDTANTAYDLLRIWGKWICGIADEQDSASRESTDWADVWILELGADRPTCELY
jgi:hypothetical protein